MTETASFSSLSVIIPTYNRKDLLARALQGYLAQSTPQLIKELLVIDDGSTDGTEAMVREFSALAPFPIRYFRQPNKGPAAARNVGIREAQSSLVLFTDSDIIPRPDLVERHIEWHNQNPQISTAVLGYVTWDPAVKATPFMRWYGERKLFGFYRLRDKREASFHFFATCNLSLKTEFLRTCGQFDEAFKRAAFEDTELGYRLSKSGMRLLYNPGAIAYHYQFFLFQDACQKWLASAPATQMFFRTEAGRQSLKEIREKQSRGSYVIAKAIAPRVAKMLSPLRRLLDSRLPLPTVLYELFFWQDATRMVNIDVEDADLSLQSR